MNLVVAVYLYLFLHVVVNISVIYIFVVSIVTKHDVADIHGQIATRTRHVIDRKRRPHDVPHGGCDTSATLVSRVTSTSGTNG